MTRVTLARLQRAPQTTSLLASQCLCVDTITLAGRMHTASRITLEFGSYYHEPVGLTARLSLRVGTFLRWGRALRLVEIRVRSRDVSSIQ